jgi:hypothetical protein
MMGLPSSVVPLALARLKRSSDWQNLGNWNWRERLAFVSHGVKTTLQVTEPAALLPIKLRLPPGWREAKDSGGQPEYSLVVGNEQAPAGLDRLHLLFRGVSLISAAYKLEPVLGALESELDRRVASLAAPERIFIQAGVVGWRGRAIVVCGGPQSGTSTLVAALLRAGALYYSDQYAVLDYEGRVHPYARPLWLCTGAQVNPVRYRPEELGARSGSQILEIGTVVFSSYRPGARPRLAALTPATASAEVMSNAVSDRLNAKAAQSAIGKALAGAWILKGIRGEAQELVNLLLRRPSGRRRAH